MPTSINDANVRAVFDEARVSQTNRVIIGGRPVEIPTPFPSPEDWRDQLICFLLVDRFNNPLVPPPLAPFYGLFGVFRANSIAPTEAVGNAARVPGSCVSSDLQKMEIEIPGKRSGS